MRRAAIVAAFALSSVHGAGCAPAREAASPVSASAPAECRAIGPLMDLRADLVDAPAADGEIAALVDVEHQLGAVSVARARIGSTTALSALGDRLEKLEATLDEHAARLAERLDAVRQSQAEVEAALDDAYTCKGIDRRFPAAAPSSTREQKRRSAFTTSTQDLEARRKRNETTLRSAECADGGRLVSALRTLDTSSHDSVKSVGGHIDELSFTGAAAKIRSRLAAALSAHAKNLATLDELRRTERVDEVARLRGDLDDLGDRCLEGMNRALDQVSDGGSRAPRQVTVLVRPTWPDPQTGKLVPSPSFGSGVLLQWRGTDGKTETRVLTNAHVMSGASSAEVLEADRVQLAAVQRKPEDTKAWKATLLRVSNDDDIAVLHVASDAGPLPKAGLALRLTPPKEQEPVTAAGFPGLAGRPSFQISTGAVSNANLKAAAGPFGVYVQHTAAIDPGNSGGPLFDADGRLLGINTIKIVGRESVGLAIPTARLQLALLRADDRPAFTPKHAASLCNAFVSMLGADEPRQELLDHLSLALVDNTQRATDAEISAYRTSVRGDELGPEDAARADVYARLRAKLEAEGGVPKLTRCAELASPKPDTFHASFATRTAPHHLTIASELGKLRVIAID